MKTFLKGWLFSLSFLFVSNTVFAHALWIDKKDGPAAVRYGEYGEGVVEKSGGKLDDITGVEAWSVAGEKAALQPVKAENGFGLNTDEPAIAQAVSLPVKDMRKYKLGIAKPHLYARWADASGADVKPEMRLDAVPSGSGRARVFFDGKPLAKEKAVWTAPNGWMKELKTDEEGFVTLDRPWPGLYVLETTHVIEVPGKFEGKDYEVERHRATLSIEKK